MTSILLRALSLSMLAAIALPLGCGSSDDDESGAGPEYDLDQVCESMAPRICVAREECCDSEGLDYSQSGCEGFEIADCEANVAKVNAGEMEYHRENVEECVTIIESVNRQCAVGVADLIALIPELKECQGVFVGQIGLGDACDTDADCEPSSDPNIWRHCGDVSGMCEEIVTNAEGESCTVQEPCASGLYCEGGSCETATALGESCDLLSGECGLGAYCDGECQAAKGGGQSCLTAFECESLNCNAGTCTAANGVANAQNCGG